jgi:pimeloyl-ACP methyl ester carboxylesterase
MGGMIAQEIAIRHKERVDRLVLACTHSGLRHSEPPTPEAAEAFQQNTDSWSERIRALAPFAFAPGYPERETSDFDAFVAKEVSDEQPLFAYRHQLLASVRHDAHDRLEQIESPTLVLTGSEDMVTPASNSVRLAAAIPNARLEVIDGAGHLFFVEKPEETRQILRSFLLDSAGPGMRSNTAG